MHYFFRTDAQHLKFLLSLLFMLRVQVCIFDSLYAVTLNFMRTVFYFILFVFNFGLLSAFYMAFSVHCGARVCLFIHSYIHMYIQMYVCIYLFSFYGHIALSCAEGLFW